MARAASAPSDQAARKANRWLEDIAAGLGVSRTRAYEALAATLHVLRDRLPPETALRFADQLPLMLRSAYLDGWELSARPPGDASAQDFMRAIQTELTPGFPAEAAPVTRAVINTMLKYAELSEVARAVAHLPEPIRALWTEEVA